MKEEKEERRGEGGEEKLSRDGGASRHTGGMNYG